MSRYESHISRDGEDMYTEEKMEPMQVDPPGASFKEAITRPRKCSLKYKNKSCIVKFNIGITSK